MNLLTSYPLSWYVNFRIIILQTPKFKCLENLSWTSNQFKNYNDIIIIINKSYKQRHFTIVKNRIIFMKNIVQLYTDTTTDNPARVLPNPIHSTAQTFRLTELFVPEQRHHYLSKQRLIRPPSQVRHNILQHNKNHFLSCLKCRSKRPSRKTESSGALLGTWIEAQERIHVMVYMTLGASVDDATRFLSHWYCGHKQGRSHNDITSVNKSSMRNSFGFLSHALCRESTAKVWGAATNN